MRNKIKKFGNDRPDIFFIILVVSSLTIFGTFVALSLHLLSNK